MNSDARELIESRRSRVVRTLDSSLAQRDAQKIVHGGELLKMLDEVEVLLGRIDPDLELLTNGGSTLAPGVVHESFVGTAKARGEARRQTIIEKLHNDHAITLTHIEGVLYRSPAGRVVGIASASERSRNRWFLGLPGDLVNEAVLLCEDAVGVLHAFFLGRDFFAQHESALSRDDRGQVKFNVVREGPRFAVNVPGRGAVEVTPNDFQGLSAAVEEEADPSRWLPSSILLLPASGEESERHFQDSVEFLVDAGRLDDWFEKSEAAELRKYTDHQLAVWGLRDNTTRLAGSGIEPLPWGRIERGTLALFESRKEIFAAARVVGKGISEQASVDLWNSGDFRWILLLDEVTSTNIPLEVVRRAAGFDSNYKLTRRALVPKKRREAAIVDALAPYLPALLRSEEPTDHRTGDSLV